MGLTVRTYRSATLLRIFRIVIFRWGHTQWTVARLSYRTDAHNETAIHYSSSPAALWISSGKPSFLGVKSQTKTCWAEIERTHTSTRQLSVLRPWCIAPAHVVPETHHGPLFCNQVAIIWAVDSNFQRPRFFHHLGAYTYWFYVPPSSSICLILYKDEPFCHKSASKTVENVNVMCQSF